MERQLLNVTEIDFEVRFYKCSRGEYLLKICLVMIENLNYSSPVRKDLRFNQGS